MEIYTLSRTIPANAWEKVTIPLTMLRSRFSIIMFQSAGNDDQGTGMTLKKIRKLNFNKFVLENDSVL